MNNPLLYNTLLAFSTVHHAQWSGQQSLLRKAKERQLQSHAGLTEALAAGDGDVDKLLPAILMGVSVSIRYFDCVGVQS
jgi:DNA-binding FadR family transcriptional regulator